MGDSFAEGLIGVILDDRYRLDALLGEGGMGAVYRAHHVAMDRRVAVKLLKPHLTQDQTALQRFAREARSTLKVESPHAVKVLDYGVTPHDDYYMVLEYLDGRTVQRELDVDGPFAPARVLHIAKQALLALGAAHRIGLIHRDIKPDNLLLMKVGDDTDYTKVLDFGVAKLMEGAAKSSRSALSLTQAGMVFGTPEFMSPEQACGQTLDPRSDLYSLAATMFAMLTGCGMYRAGSAIEWLTAHARQPPPHLVDGNPALADQRELDAFLQRCFAKHADDRPADADAMIREVEEVERRLGLAPTATPALPPVAAPRPKLAATFSPSSFIPALPPEVASSPAPAQARALAPTMFDSTAAETALPPESGAFGATGETGAVAAPSRRGLIFVIGGLAIAAMVVVAIAIAAAGKAKQPVVAAKPIDPHAIVVDATQVVVVPPIDAAIATPAPADAAQVASQVRVPTPTGSGTARSTHAAEFEAHMAAALAAQQTGNRLTQITQAHAAVILEPKNARALLLLADGELAYGNLEFGCKYLRELPRNQVAIVRARSAGCPAD